MVTLVCQSLNNAKVQKICRRLLEEKQKKTNRQNNLIKLTKKKKKIPFLLLHDSPSFSHPSHNHKQAVFGHMFILALSPTVFSGSLLYSKDKIIQLLIIPEFPLTLSGTCSPWCSGVSSQKESHIITLPIIHAVMLAFKMEFHLQKVLSQMQSGTSESLVFVG